MFHLRDGRRWKQYMRIEFVKLYHSLVLGDMVLHVMEMATITEAKYFLNGVKAEAGQILDGG
jgi:hypothetical protein